MPISTVPANSLRRSSMSKTLTVLAFVAAFGLLPCEPAAAQRTPGAKKKSGSTPQATAKPGAPAPAGPMQIDSETLPKDFEPPQAPPEVMQINRPLLTQAQLDALKRVDSKFNAAVTKSQWKDAQSQELIRGGIQYRLARLTNLDNREDWMKARDELMRSINGMGKLSPNADDTKKAREFMLAEVVKQCALLLDNNFYARLHAVFILSELNLTDEDPKKNLKTEAFVPAVEPLLTVLKDPNQPEAIKVLAIRGVVRILSNSSPDVKTKQKVAAVLVSELANEKAHPWYQRRLAYAMAFVDISVDLNRKPVLVETLQKVVADPKRDWVTRAEACRSLGRVAYDPSVDTRAVLTTITNFVAEAATAASTSAKNPHWKSVFGRLYLTFKEQDAGDRDVEKKGPGGLLNRPQFNQPEVKKVYPLVVDVFNATIAGAPIPAEAVKALQALQKPGAPPNGQPVVGAAQ